MRLGCFFSFFHKYESFPQPSNSWLLNTLLQLGNSSYLNKQTDGWAGTCVGRSYLACGAPRGMLALGHSGGTGPQQGRGTPAGEGHSSHALPRTGVPRKSGSGKWCPRAIELLLRPLLYAPAAPLLVAGFAIHREAELLPARATGTDPARASLLPCPGANARPRFAGADPVPLI